MFGITRTFPSFSLSHITNTHDTYIYFLPKPFTFILKFKQNSFNIYLSPFLGAFSIIYRDTSIAGTGESGKSTVFKQMKIIQDHGGYSTDELMEYKYIIYGNCITQMKCILDAAEKLNMTVANTENAVCYISSYLFLPLF